MKTRTSRKAGFTLVEIMIVVAIIGMLAAIAIPNFMRARTTAQANACISNLRNIDNAIQQWAMENNKGASANVTAADLKPYLGRTGEGQAINTSGGQIAGDINCPAGGAYTVTTVSAKPTCSLSTLTDHPHILP